MNDPRYPKSTFPILHALDVRLGRELERSPRLCERCEAAGGVSVTRSVDNIPRILCESCEDAVLAYVRRETFTIVR